MAYSTQTTDSHEHPIRFVVFIHGIEQVFVSQSVSPTSLVSSRTQLVTLMQDSLSFGEEVLDMQSRAVTGGGLTFRLRDDDDETLLGLFGFRDDAPRTVITTGSYTRSGSSPTTITVDDTTGFASSGTIHVGAEAISYTSTNATQFINATRAAYDSTQTDIRPGNSDYNGPVVTQKPQFWRGRRVTVKAGYRDADGTMADLVEVGTYRILEPPRSVDDGSTYEIQCGPLSDLFREARCYLGLRPATMQEYDAGIGGETFETHEFNDQLSFISGSSANQYALIASDENTYRLSKVASVTGTGITVEDTDVLTPTAYQLNAQSEQATGAIAKSIQHVALLTGNPVDILLYLLTSIEGDGTNGDWDNLPGVTATAYGAAQWRMGAGIAQADINKVDPDTSAAVGSVMHLKGSGHRWHYLLNETLDVGELLREFCVTTGSYWYINSSGLLSFERLRDLAPPTLTSESVTLNNSTVVTPAPLLRYSEDALAHTVRLKLNWEPITGRHMVTISVTDWELRERYLESAQEINAESKFLNVRTNGFALAPSGQRLMGSGNGSTVEAVASQLRRAQNLNAFGEAFAEMTCAWNASGLRVGEFVDLNLPRTPDTKGGRLTTGRGVVVGRRLSPTDMTVKITVRVMEAGRVIAPVGVISSVSTTTNTNDTWTLDTTDSTVDPALTSQADAFGAGWSIQVYDVSAVGSVGIRGPFVISSVVPGSDQIILTADPGFVPVAGDYFWPVRDEALPDATSGLDEDDFAWMTDLDGLDEDSRFS